MNSQSDNTSKDQTPTLDEQLRDILFRAAGGISNMAEVEIPAIKQAVYAALVEQWPKKKRQPRQGGSICQDWLIGHNQAIDEALSVLSAVLGIGEEK